MIPINAIFRATAYFYEITASGEKWAELRCNSLANNVDVYSGWKNERANLTRRFVWNLKGEVTHHDVGHAS